MFLKSENIYLRALEPTDLDFLYKLENDVSGWNVSNTVTPYSKEVIQQYLDNAAADIYTVKQLRLIICKTDNQAVGAIDIFDFDPLHLRAGIGITILEQYRRQQFASEALNLLLQYCSQNLLLHQVYCTIAISNEASLSLFNKVGFKTIGIRKEWLRTRQGWENVAELQLIFK